MSVIKIYRKKDNKEVLCDIKQLDLMTKGEDAAYSTTKVDLEDADSDLKSKLAAAKKDAK